LVFVAKYRRNIFTKKVLKDLENIFENVCNNFEAKLIEVNGEFDHVHLLVNYPPKVCLAKLVNSLKGVSSRMIKQKQYPSVKKALWGKKLWSSSYFAASCGGAPLEIIEKYIKDQASP
jgi:putative transposase